MENFNLNTDHTNLCSTIIVTNDDSLLTTLTKINLKKLPKWQSWNNIDTNEI